MGNGKRGERGCGIEKGEVEQEWREGRMVRKERIGLRVGKEVYSYA